MANAKTYNDLNQATEVNDTDKLALAQSDKQELVTATVGQVAQKVANIVSTDQVTEIVTDLGMGKQIMAQKLQDKGLDVTASDTLTAMANKVDTLDVVGAKEYQQAIPCKAVYSSSRSTIKAILCGSLNKFIQIDVTGGVLSIGKMNNSKTIDVEMTITDTRLTKFPNPPVIGTSNNHQYIALAIAGGSVKTLIVYRLNWTQKTIEFVYEHTYTSNITDNTNSVYITDDGEKVFVFTDSSYYDYQVYYDHTSDTEKYTGRVNTDNIDTEGGYLDEENSRFLFPGYYQSVNNRWGLASVSYTISETGVTFGSPVAIVVNPTSSSDVNTGSLSIIVKDMDLLITNGRAGSSDTYYSDFKLKVFKISTGELLNTLIYNRFQLTTSTYDSGTSFKAWKDNNKLYVGTGVGLLVSVSADGTITDEIGTPDINGKIRPMCTFNVNNNYNIGIPGYNVNGDFIDILPAYSYNGFTSSSWTTTLYPSIIYKKCVIGNWYKRNNQQVLQKITWSDADYEAGAYDIDNTKAEVEI